MWCIKQREMLRCLVTGHDERWCLIYDIYGLPVSARHM